MPQHHRIRITTAARRPSISVISRASGPASPPIVRKKIGSTDIILPDLSYCVTMDVKIAASGGFGNIWQGEFDTGSGTCVVAVKHLRPRGAAAADWGRMDLRLRREITVWKRLRHANIVPLFGTISSSYPFIGMISPWMQKGNLNTFIKTNTLAYAHRLQLPCDIAAGLTYLHSEGIIHGDLTGANVLIDDSGVACLVDFGLSLIKVDFEGTSFITSTVGGAMRFRAPELLPSIEVEIYDKFKATLTFACDIYSLGSVTLQALSSQAPYFNIPTDICVLLALSRGTRPERPPCDDLTDDYWELIERCWVEPTSRPCADVVHTSLVNLRYAALKPSYFPREVAHPLTDGHFVSWPCTE